MTQAIDLPVPATAPKPARGVVTGSAPVQWLLMRWLVLPWWGQALIVFGASRIVTTLLFLWVGTQATENSRVGLHPTLLGFASAWDGQWYWTVADNGYPTTLPRTSGGVQQNAWAFLPVYPYLVKLLALGNGAAWPLTATLVSIAFGFGAAVLLALLLRPRIGTSAALFAVVLMSVSPVAFMFQTTYAESMGLFLTLAALCLLDRHRYVAAIPISIVLAFTRPGVLALALAVGLHLMARLWEARRTGVRVPRRQIGAAVALGAITGVAGFAWVAIVGAVTGVPDAYFQTELAWRELWMGRTQFSYFTPWVFVANYLFGTFAGPLLLGGIILGFAVLLFVPRVRRLGLTVRFWLASYALYLLAVFFPQSSILRLLIPMAPLGGALMPRSTVAKVVLVVGSIALQGLWLWCTYGPFQAYWGVP